MLDIQKHKLILVQILKDIYSDSHLGPLLGFKGGTAAYLFYGLPRFSVDLDFNLVEPEKKDVVFEKVKKILKNYGELKEAREKRFTLFFLLSYEEDYQNVKVEISKKVFPNHYEVKNYLGISMLVMTKEDMFAHKLVAFLDRGKFANRDVFDLWFFMKERWDFNKDLVEMRTGMNYKLYLERCLRALEKINERHILQGLGELLGDRQKEWVRKSLKSELIFLMKYYIKNYYPYSSEA